MVDNASQTAFIKIKPKAQVVATQTFIETKNASTNVDIASGLLAYEVLSKNSIDFKSLIGFSVEKFNLLCDFLDITQIQQCIGVNFPKISQKEELLIVLVKIRRGYTFQELSYFAKLDMKFLLLMFNKWIDFMYRQLFGVYINMELVDDKEVVQKLTKNLERFIYTYKAGTVLH